MIWWAHEKQKNTRMTTLAQISVDSLDMSLEDIESVGKVPSLNELEQQQQAANTATARYGSDSGLDTASLSNTSYELLRGISCHSTDYDGNVPTADLLGLSPPEKQCLSLACEKFEKMHISHTAAGTTTTTTTMRQISHKSTPKASAEKAEFKNSKNLQRASSLSRAQRATKPLATPTTTTNDNNAMSKSLLRQSQSLCSNTRSLQRTPSLARTRQLSMPRTVIDTGRRLSSINGIATLPRSCRQKSVDDLSSQNSRSSSVARDSNTRMYNSMVGGQLPLMRKNLMNTSYGGSCSSSNASVVSGGKRVKPTRTTIYHETGTQTVLTHCYLEQMLAGRHVVSNLQQLGTNKLSCEQHTQTYIRDQELAQAQQSEQLLGEALQAERKQRQDVEQRLLSLGNMALNLRANISCSSLDGVQQVHDVNAALLLLESLLTLSGCELKDRQQECAEMRLYCCTLQQSLKQCMEAQQFLIQENKEHLELQDFIQHEKTALEVQLRDIEAENQAHKKQLEERNAEIRILRGECCHLVRLNEQRRYALFKIKFTRGEQEHIVHILSVAVEKSS